jgi:response regulator of citrate/malate metabolism
MMKVVIISNDQKLIDYSTREDIDLRYKFITNNSSNDSLDLMAQICSINPSTLILDDDFISPNSAHLMESIKKVNPKLKTIFITSDSSVELGKKIYSIGVKFYMIKPISEFKLGEFLKSIENEETKNNLLTNTN